MSQIMPRDLVSLSGRLISRRSPKQGEGGGAQNRVMFVDGLFGGRNSPSTAQRIEDAG